MLKPVSQQGEGPLWELSTEGSCLHLCLLGRIEDNTKTLRSDFMVSVEGDGMGHRG